MGLIKVDLVVKEDVATLGRIVDVEAEEHLEDEALANPQTHDRTLYLLLQPQTSTPILKKFDNVPYLVALGLPLL